MKVPFYLVRHGESETNATIHDIVARGEVPPGPTYAASLTEKGRVQAISAASFVHSASNCVKHVWSSYYVRARQTAAQFGGVPFVDSRVAEQQRGVWHTMHRNTIATLLPWEIERAEREGWYHYRPLGGENVPDVELRARAFFRDAYDFLDGVAADVVVVTHGHWIAAVTRMCAQPYTGPDHATKFPIPGNDSVTRVLYSPSSGFGFPELLFTPDQ